MVHIGTREYDRRFAFLEEITHPVAVHHRVRKNVVFMILLLFLLLFYYTTMQQQCYLLIFMLLLLSPHTPRWCTLHKYDRRVADDDRGGPHSLSLHVVTTHNKPLSWIMSSGYALDDSERRTILTILKTTALTSRKGKAAITDVEDKPETKINTKKQDVSKTNSTIKQKQANQSSNISNSTNVKAKTNSSKKLA